MKKWFNVLVDVDGKIKTFVVEADDEIEAEGRALDDATLGCSDEYYPSCATLISCVECD